MPLLPPHLTLEDVIDGFSLQSEPPKIAPVKMTKAERDAARAAKLEAERYAAAPRDPATGLTLEEFLAAGFHLPQWDSHRRAHREARDRAMRPEGFSAGNYPKSLSDEALAALLS